MSFQKNSKAKFGRLSKLSHEFGNSGKSPIQSQKKIYILKDVDGTITRADMIKRAMEGGGEDFR